MARSGGSSRYWRSKELATPNAASCSRRARLGGGRRLRSRPPRRIAQRGLVRIRPTDRAQRDDESHAGDDQRVDPGRQLEAARGADPDEHERDRRNDEESQRCEDVPSHEVTARWRNSGALGCSRSVRSSSRTCTSAPIAASFIVESTS